MDVTALAEAVVEEYRALGHPVTFDPSDRQVVAVQPNLLRRALRNLIDNGIHYAGAANVAVLPNDKVVEIRVSDKGPGIPPDQMEQVLEPFYRLEGSRNRESGGSGLGLAIAQSIAESHGGGLRLERLRPTGLAAIISLPA